MSQSRCASPSIVAPDAASFGSKPSFSTKLREPRMVFIPNFGPILSMIPAVLLALTQGWETALWVVALYVGAQLVDNTVMTPLIQRQAVSLPPALTMIAQTAMGVLAGFLGLVVAVPLTALALVLVRRIHVDPLEGTAGPILTGQ